MFLVLLALAAVLRGRGWFNDERKERNLASLLGLVALGTVADVVKLDRNNRILVSQGLKRMREGKLTPGIRALFRAAGQHRAATRRAQPRTQGDRGRHPGTGACPPRVDRADGWCAARALRP